MTYVCKEYDGKMKIVQQLCMATAKNEVFLVYNIKIVI